MKKNFKDSNIIFHDYFENYGGGERLIKILSKKKFNHLFVGFDSEIYKKYFSKNKIKFHQLCLKNYPNFIKKILLIFLFKNINFVCKNIICSGNYSVFSNIKAKCKIAYIHSLPKIFFKKKNFYSKFSLKVYLANILFFNFKKQYIKKLDSFDHIICNSKYTKKQLEKIISKKIKVVYPPIEKLNLKKQKINFHNFFLFNNRHEKEKNLDKVLEAFKILKNQNLIILSNGSLTNKFKSEYNDLKNVSFKGMVNDINYARYLANCKATINVSVDEDFGMAAIEPMQFGKVTFCLNHGGYLETTKNNYNSIHIDKNHITEDLIKKIKKTKISKLVNLKKNCIKTYIFFSEKNFTKKIVNLLTK